MARINDKAICISYCISSKRQSSFWRRCLGEFIFHRGVYANINTKYFFDTLDICFDLIFDTLLLFFCEKTYRYVRLYAMRFC